MSNIKVLYHKNCLDGFSAAWAAWKSLGDEAEYIPVSHQAEPIQGLQDSILYFVDFSYPKETIEQLKKDNKRVIIIDHHESVKEDIKVADETLFDLDHSGAVLAWQYFHPDKPVPEMLRYVEDIDLWNLDMEHTREVIAFLGVWTREFSKWSELAEGFEDEKQKESYLEKGRLLLKYKDQLISRIEQKADLVEFEGHKVLAVNSPVFPSDLGHRLYEKVPPIAIVWYEFKENVKVSLRSDGSVDVSKIAGKYGGGGHPGSAGFKVSALEDFPWKIINDKNQ